MLAPLWDELEERQRRKFLKDIREKGDSFTEKEKKREGQIREGGHQRMQVEEERVTGRQRHTKQDSEDGEEVGEKREAMEMGEGVTWAGTELVFLG